MILESGNTPRVLFDGKEYAVVEKYKHIKITYQNFRYSPTRGEIEEAFLKKNLTLDIIFGEKAYTSFHEFEDIVSSIPTNKENYEIQILGIIREMIYMNNLKKDTLSLLTFHVNEYSNLKYQYTAQDFEDLYTKSLTLKPYEPRWKCVIFNPLKPINSILKMIIMSQKIGEYNAYNVDVLAEKYTIEDIAKIKKAGKTTIKKNLKKLGISTQGNKKNKTYKRVQKWKHNHKTGTQKECSIALKISIRTVKEYWNKYFS
jgi:hypothetical protein